MYCDIFIDVMHGQASLLFSFLLLWHVLCDFYWQPTHWVTRRSWQAASLYKHAGLHGLGGLAAGLVPGAAMLPMVATAAVISVTHALIDGFKSTVEKWAGRPAAYLIDQLLHVAVLVVASCWVSGNWSHSPHLWLPVTPAIWAFTAVLLAMKPGSFFIKIVLEELTPQQAQSSSPTLQSAGRYIGYAERLLILLAVCSRHVELAGYLLAAKSVLRIGDLTKNQEQRLTEYILLGTLLSFGWGLVIALGYAWLSGLK